MSNTDSQKNSLNLVYLASCAVNNKIPEKARCDEMDMSAVLELARVHLLAAAAAYALEKTVALTEEFREEKYKAVRRLSLFNVERAKVLSELEKQDIWYLPLKGIVIKDYYPKSAMREMGDNDILFDSSKAEEVKNIMEGLGYTCKGYGTSHHDIYFKQPYIKFEMHRTLTDKPKFRVYFNNIKDKLIKDSDNKSGYHMTDEDFYIYLIWHLYNHYTLSGTGLRSVLDVYVFNNRFREKLDSEYLETEFNKLGLNDFESKIRDFANRLFTGQELSEAELSELRFLVESGADGTKGFLWMYRLNNDDSGKAKTKYALSRLFPSGKSLKEHHPFVYRHRAVYPFWVIYRPIKGVVKHRKMMFNEIKRLKNFKKKENTGQLNK